MDEFTATLSLKETRLNYTIWSDGVGNTYRITQADLPKLVKHGARKGGIVSGRWTRKPGGFVALA